MHCKSEQERWEAYRDRELAAVTPVLAELGFTLEHYKPHIQGERYLMQAVTTAHGRKLILLGHRVSDSKRVVIKTTSDPAGKQELEHERQCREVLHKINFAYDVFFSPEEILFTHKHPFIISIQAFLEQKCPFLERPIENQFALALAAFKAQEGAHAATFEQRRLIERTFGSLDAQGYLNAFAAFGDNAQKHLPNETQLHALFEKTSRLLGENREIIEQYSSFLTHVDFVPHNFRIVNNRIHLLDYSSLRFGNKYEGWARFINFMVLYNPPLAKALVEYVRDNRTEEECVSLRLMRLYRLGEIVWYYVNTLKKSSGDLHTLNKKRVAFWSQVLESVLTNTPVAEHVVEEYERARDALRSKEEKQRQVGLH